MAPLFGVLVGGPSSRMGTPKGLLRTGDGELLLERTIRIGRDANLRVALVGDASSYEGHAPEIPRIPDGEGAGPIGGLHGALRSLSVEGQLILVGCDMPYLRLTDLVRLANDPRRGVIAPWRDDWEPLFTRYDAALLPELEDYLETGRRSLRGFLDRVKPHRFEVDGATLNDWDRPEDIPD
ncbi:MAG: molybdenum cofactor guanylyltransferase [Myxococcota bacterium]